MTRFLSTLLFIVLQIAVHGQLQPQYTFFFLNPQLINPASNGCENALAAAASTRSLWNGIDGVPQTNSFSLHSPLRKNSMALGLNLTSDAIGVSRNTKISTSIVYRLKLGKGLLSFGLQGAYQLQKNNWSQIILVDQLDDTFNMGDEQHGTPDAGAGIYFYDKKSFVGISVPSMFTAEYRGGGKYSAVHSTENYNWHIIAGRNFKLHNNWMLKPSMLLKLHSASNMQADVVCQFVYSGLFEMGAGYRVNDAWMLLAQLHVNEQFAIAYSFDHYTSTVNRLDRGTHEFMLKYVFLYNTQSPDTRLISK